MVAGHSLGGVNPLPRQLELPSHLVPKGTPTARLLERERSKASFDSGQLAEYLFGREWLERKDKLLNILEKEEAFDKSRLPYLGRTERFRFALRKEKRFVQLMNEQKWTAEEMTMAEWLLDMPGPFGLHKSMFLETLRSQTTDEQKKEFLEPAQEFKIIGCYAQTELGHGSNVQGTMSCAFLRASVLTGTRIGNDSHVRRRNKGVCHQLSYPYIHQVLGWWTWSYCHSLRLDGTTICQRQILRDSPICRANSRPQDSAHI